MTFNQLYKLARTSKFEENVDLRSHMAKNSEWGAISYLSYSQYGTNGDKVEKNTSSSYYTGASDNKAVIYTANKKQSTTGNATGVYDLNGGAWECVASYVNSGSSNLATYGGTASGDLYGANATERKTSTEYKMVYEGSGNQSADYEIAKKYKGDSVYEISNAYSSMEDSWFSSPSQFPVTNSPFFSRGGRDQGYSSIFCFTNGTGNSFSGTSFRPVLAP